MLKNRYDEILVGMNLMSLLRGIVSRFNKKSVLLIHDKRFLSESYPASFFSEIEVLGFMRIGKNYDIPELIDIRQFLLQGKQNFVTEQTQLTLGRLPFENLKELLRKYPELISKNDLDLVFQSNEEEFDQLIFSEIKRFESYCYDFRVKTKTKKNEFQIQGPGWLKNIFDQFSLLINQRFSESKNLKYSQLLHFLGISYEDKIKIELEPEEIPFYFLRLLSPIYRLEDFFIMNQLKRRFLIKGGDFKESSIQYWQLQQNKFQNLLLASFEGVISGTNVLFFSHLPDDVPFDLKSDFPFYRKTRLISLTSDSSPYPPHHITFLADEGLIGTEKPYRVALFDKKFVSYEMPYLEMPASKPEFYLSELQKSFLSDSKVLFNLDGQSQVSDTMSVSIDLRSLNKGLKKSPFFISEIPIEIIQNEKKIAGFHYWGPFKFKSLGLLALCYGIEA